MVLAAQLIADVDPTYLWIGGIGNGLSLLFLWIILYLKRPKAAKISLAIVLIVAGGAFATLWIRASMRDAEWRQRSAEEEKQAQQRKAAEEARLAKLSP